MSDNFLARITEADRLLSIVETPQEAAEIADKAAALATWAKRSNAAIPVINKAVAIKLSAERKAGEMLAGMDLRKNQNAGHNVLPALSDFNISKMQSSRWQQMAKVPKEEFTAYVAQCDEAGREVTSNGLYKMANKHAPKNGARAPDVTDGTHTDLAQLNGQKFGTIYADPPWRYSNQVTRAATDNHYKTMSVEEICAMPVASLAADKAHLHLWTTNAFIFECPKIMEAWGFEFRSTFVWVKPSMGIGNYWRNSHEIMLLGIRGGQTAISRSEMSWIECGRGAHSSKPQQVRERSQRLSPGPYLELFGRRSIPGWHVFGNEIIEQLL